MHPYRHLLTVEEELLSRKQVSALRVVAFLEVLFGSAIIGMELAANLLEQDADIFTSIVGIWAGFITVMTGLAAYTNSRITGNFHPLHANLLAISHTFTSAFAAVSTLGVFGMRCMALRSVPSPYHPAAEGDTSACLWSVPLILEYILILVYVINSMVLGVSFGISGTVLRAVRKAKLTVPDADDVNVQLESTPDAFAVGCKNEKTQVITDIEAAAEGYYRRLEEEDNEEI